MKLETEDDQLMAVAAHRYCLGRQSYIVGTCIDWLRATWPQMTPNTKYIILRDTIDALVNARAGCPRIDAPDWRKAVEWMVESLTPEQRAAMRVTMRLRCGDAGAAFVPEVQQ